MGSSAQFPFTLIQEYQANKKLISLGALPENDIVLSGLSSHFAILTHNFGDWQFTRIDNKTPCLINGKKVLSGKDIHLKQSDTIFFDSYALQIQITGEDTFFKVFKKVPAELYQESTAFSKIKKSLPFLSLVIAFAAICFFVFSHPTIQQFSSSLGEDPVIRQGESVKLFWEVSPFSTRTIFNGPDGKGSVENRSEVPLTLERSAVYQLSASNPLSRLFGTSDSKDIHIVTIPQEKAVIERFECDQTELNNGESTNLYWNTTGMEHVHITINGEDLPISPQQKNGKEKITIRADSIISLFATDPNGEVFSRSLFIRAKHPNLGETSFSIWLHPNAQAIPLTMLPEKDDPVSMIKNWDNFKTQATMMPLGEANASQTLPAETLLPIPDHLSFNDTKAYTIKYAEIVPDPNSPNGFQTMSYFPNVAIPMGEPILLKWSSPEKTKVSFSVFPDSPLENEGEILWSPEKSMNVTLTAETGKETKKLSLPVLIATTEETNTSQTPTVLRTEKDSGQNCTLSATPNGQTATGIYTLTWTGGGIGNRVQILSSLQADKEKKAFIEALQKQAVAAGQGYISPSLKDLPEGIIADWLQESGFFKVNIQQNTVFILRVIDGITGVPVCEKHIEIKIGNSTPSKEKRYLKVKIEHTANEDNQEQNTFAVNQAMRITAPLAGWEKTLPPTGTIHVTDGFSSCTIALPADSCELQLKIKGKRTLTAQYYGDENYKSSSAQKKISVINPLPTQLEILQAAQKNGKYSVAIRLNFNEKTASQYGIRPGGILRLNPETDTCIYNFSKKKASCGGAKVVMDPDGHTLRFSNLTLSKNIITAEYKEDPLMEPSIAEPKAINKTKITLKIISPKKNQYFDISGKNNVLYPEFPLQHDDPYNYCKFSPERGCAPLMNKASVTISLQDEKGNILIPENGTKFIVRDGRLTDYTNTCTILYPNVSCDLPLSRTGVYPIGVEFQGSEQYEATTTELDPITALDFSGENQFTPNIAITSVQPHGPFKKGDNILISVNVSNGKNSPNEGIVAVIDENTEAFCAFEYTAGGSNQCSLVTPQDGSLYLTAFYLGSPLWRPGRSLSIDTEWLMTAPKEKVTIDIEIEP